MRRIYIVAIAALFYSQQTISEQTATLDEYTVTARPVGLQSIEHITQPVTVLRGDELREKQASTIGETLENIPGVTTDHFSPFASRPVIRGQSGMRIRVLENGIGSMDVSTISVDHAVSIDPIQAEQIEIFRGPSTLLYGSEAAGGFVNVVTNRIPEYVPDSFSPKLYSSYNSNSSENLISFQAEGGLEKVALHIDAVHRNAGNYESKDRQINNSFYDSTNYNFGTSFVDDWGFLGMSYGRFKSTHSVPFNPEEPDELPFLDSEQNRIDLSGQINSPLPKIKAINIQGGYNNYDHTEFEDVGEPGTVFSNEQFEGRVEFQHTPIGMFNGVVGTQFGARDISAVGEEAFLPKTNTENIAIFILEETDINDALHFEIGGRYEYQENTTDDGRSVNEDLYSFSSGIHWHFTKDVGLGLNISRSQRMAAAEELFSNGPHHATGTFELGQTNLEVETSNSIDLSIMREKGPLQWNLNLFVNYIEDCIFQQELDLDGDGEADEVDESGTEAGELILVQYQQDDAIFYGFEAAANFNLYNDNRGKLDLSVFADYVRGKREKGENLPRISPARIGIGLDYQQGKLTGGIDLTNVLAQKDNGSLETDTDGYSLLNLNANYNLFDNRQSLDVFFKATNLLDEDGRLHTSFIKDRAPIMGRAVTVGFQAEF